MSTIDQEQRRRLLAELAGSLRRHGLTEVALLLARSLCGAHVVVSHMLLAAQPLLPHARWRQSLGDYAILLEDGTSWQTLIDHLEASDS